jgi:hypothetical protein
VVSWAGIIPGNQSARRPRLANAVLATRQKCATGAAAAESRHDLGISRAAELAGRLLVVTNVEEPNGDATIR